MNNPESLSTPIKAACLLTGALLLSACGGENAENALDDQRQIQVDQLPDNQQVPANQVQTSVAEQVGTLNGDPGNRPGTPQRPNGGANNATPPGPGNGQNNQPNTDPDGRLPNNQTNNPPNNQTNNPAPNQPQQIDQILAQLLEEQNHTADPGAGLVLDSIDSPIAQLGMRLFYSKSLGGETDSACVSCHHPALGGTDNLSLGIGVEAIQPDLLGPGRHHLVEEFTVPRNAPTTFNSGLYRRSLFWDSRVQQLDSGIRTPESDVVSADSNAGDTLLRAQAKFPVTSIEEMRTSRFESDQSNQRVRDHLAARIGGYDGGFNANTELQLNNWESQFQTAFGSSETASTLVSYDNIAIALAAFENSQVFIDSPWKRYVDGDLNAISTNAKRGATLFFGDANEGGGGCSRCHSGDLFSDEEHHVVAFPQIGHGKGDGATGDDDFGRERETGNRADRYKFRTPSLLNIARTAPYGHTGSYATLRDVVRHYDRPQNALNQLRENDWCNGLNQFADVRDCNAVFPNARENTRNALRVLNDQPRNESINSINLNNNEIDQIVAFLQTLTDPCTEDRECLSAWVPAPDGGPDGNQLNGVDQNGNAL